MEKGLAPSTPRIDLVLQYLQDRCTPLSLWKTKLNSSWEYTRPPVDNKVSFTIHKRTVYNYSNDILL